MRCKSVPVFCWDKPERSGGYQRNDLTVEKTRLHKLGLTQALPGTCWSCSFWQTHWQQSGKEVEEFEHLDGAETTASELLPLEKVNGRAALIPIACVNIFPPPASILLVEKAHCYGCLHATELFWGKTWRNINLQNFVGTGFTLLPTSEIYIYIFFSFNFYPYPHFLMVYSFLEWTGLCCPAHLWEAVFCSLTSFRKRISTCSMKGIKVKSYKAGTKSRTLCTRCLQPLQPFIYLKVLYICTFSAVYLFIYL